MKNTLFLAGAAMMALMVSAPLRAELAVGAKAPDFTTQAARGGKSEEYHLAKALKHGPVVLYFYPKAFTTGCTLEAHGFAEAIDDFGKAGATVIGLSADDMPTLQRFSTEECRSKFPVAIATPEMIAAYDAAFKRNGAPVGGFTARTSYVIGRDGKIAMVWSAMDWKEHVSRSLAAVRVLAQAN